MSLPASRSASQRRPLSPTMRALARLAPLVAALAVGAVAGHQFALRSGQAVTRAEGSVSATQLLPLLAGPVGGGGVALGAHVENGVLILPAERVRQWLRANAQQTTSAAQADERQRLLVELARVAPGEALADVARLKGHRGVQAQVAVLEGWASHDPLAALEWVRAQPQPSNATYDVRLQTMGRSHPDAAIELAESLSRERPLFAQEFHLAALIGMTTQGRWDAATRWAVSAAMPADQTGILVNYVAGAWAEFDAPAALAWVHQLPATRRDQALSNVAESWAGSDPSGAAHYASARMPAGDARDELLRRAIEQWLRHDPEEAARWISSAGDRTSIDKAIMGLVTDARLIRQDPSSAIDWTAQIGDPRLREEAQRQIRRELQ
jgi:hypothetical protein